MKGIVHISVFLTTQTRQKLFVHHHIVCTNVNTTDIMITTEGPQQESSEIVESQASSCTEATAEKHVLIWRWRLSTPKYKVSSNYRELSLSLNWEHKLKLQQFEKRNATASVSSFNWGSSCQRYTVVFTAFEEEQDMHHRLLSRLGTVLRQVNQGLIKGSENHRRTLNDESEHWFSEG